jgi:serine/threonine protein kinase
MQRAYDDLVPVRTARGTTKRPTKFVLPCQRYADAKDKAWLSVTSMLSETQPVLKGVIKNGKAVVIKHGNVPETDNDCAIAKALFDAGVPNVIKYYCHFTCKDTADYVNNNRHLFERNRDFLCNGDPGSGSQRGFVVMPFYETVPVKGEKNFHAFKNLLMQVVLASLHAFQRCGFVHGDMNTGNVLFRKTTQTSVSYGDLGTLEVANGIYAVIMDFGRSRILSDDVDSVYDGLETYIALSRNESDFDMTVSGATGLLATLRKNKTPVSASVAKSVVEAVAAIGLIKSRSDDAEANSSRTAAWQA